MHIGFITDLSEKDFAFAAENGGLSLEINCSGKPFDYVKNQESIKKLAEKHGVKICSVGLWGKNHISTDDGERKQCAQELQELMDYAHFFGARIFMTGGGHVPDWSVARQTRELLELLPDWVGAAKQRDLQLCLYNCHWTNFCIGPDAWKPIFEAFPNGEVGIKFDPSHPYHDGFDYHAQICEWGDRIKHFHAKDVHLVNGKNFDEPPAGLGDICWNRLISALYHHKYEGELVIEPHSRTWSGERSYDCIKLAARHLAQFIA